MSAVNWEEYHAALKKQGIKIRKGLSDSEFNDIEKTFEFCFPPDLKAFLSIGLPVSKGWVNWRGDSRKSIQERLDWPYDGMCFDIEHDGFWMSDWGDKPESLTECFEVARQAILAVPRLIPVFLHRYIPDSPAEEGNPIFSVYQTDIIYYGSSLGNYLDNEFKLSSSELVGTPKIIPFWSKLAEW